MERPTRRLNPPLTDPAPSRRMGAVSLRSPFALAGSRGAQVDEVAADRGVMPHPGLVLRAVVEDRRAEGMPACFETGPQLVLLGDEDVAQQRAGDLAPAGAFG